MISLVLLPFALSAAFAYPYDAGYYPVIAAQAPAAPLAVVPAAAAVQVSQPDGLSYTATNVNTATGNVKQQTAVGKDVLGGHTIKHTAQATNVDPHTGKTDVKHDEHEFHINPYSGHAVVHTNNAEGSLDPSIGHAAYSQKVHEAKLAPGHASVADVDNKAAVNSFSSAASRDVSAASTDVMHDGIQKKAHQSHKSYVNAPGLASDSKAAETNLHSFDGPGYGKLHYNTQSASESYDALGHAAAKEDAYKLDQAYDARVNLGARNELQYSRHAAHDPYGNYGAVTQTKETKQGGKLVPTAHHQAIAYAPEIIQPVVKEVVPQPVLVAQPVVKEVSSQNIYIPQPVAKEIVQPIAYQPVAKEVVQSIAYQPVAKEVVPVAYQPVAKEIIQPAVYQPVPKEVVAVSYQPIDDKFVPTIEAKEPTSVFQSVSYVSHPETVVKKHPVAIKEVAYSNPQPLAYAQPIISNEPSQFEPASYKSPEYKEPIYYGYSEPVPVSYRKKSVIVQEEPRVVYKKPVIAYGVGSYDHPPRYMRRGYYKHGY